ncbi:metal ABC transporter substrate-binding protein [Mesobacillus foraminis]|uniref:metal ABC transporter substrate-binding protein n=1 Tax=Mesobacillus foraminis TaxID=279826 RepID=UPI00399EF613
MKIPTMLSTVITAGLILAGCGKETNSYTSPDSNKEVMDVYTTIYPLEDFTQKIGGEFVDVQSVLPPNVDAHSFEPSTKDMMNLADSDLFIYTGAGIEGFAEKAVESLKNEDVTIVKAADNIELLSVEEESHDHEEGAEEESHDNHDEAATEEKHESHHSSENNGGADVHEDEHSGEEDEHVHEHGDTDPHVWLDPNLSIQLAENIKNALTEKMPEKKKAFESNYNLLKKDLEKLDQDFKETVGNSKTNYLLVSHAAYGYWENRYGIDQIAISGLSPTQEPSQKELEEIIEESKAHNIRYLMFEQNVSPRVSEVIQKEIGAKSLTLYNLESITEEDRSKGEDYFSIMRKNLENIKMALN